VRGQPTSSMPRKACGPARVRARGRGLSGEAQSASTRSASLPTASAPSAGRARSGAPGSKTLAHRARQAHAALADAFGEQHRVDERAAAEAGQRRQVSPCVLLHAAAWSGDAVSIWPSGPCCQSGRSPGCVSRVDLGAQVEASQVSKQVKRRLQHQVQLGCAAPRRSGLDSPPGLERSQVHRARSSRRPARPPPDREPLA